MDELNLIVLFVIFAVIIFNILYFIFRNYFEYPYKYIYIDISGRRNVVYENEIDKYICEHRLGVFEKHLKYVKLWKNDCLEQINKSLLKQYRTRQFESILDDDSMFIFVFVRSQTRYRQYRYVKQSYKVDNVVEKLGCSFFDIEKRYYLLEKIDFQCSVKEYISKDQRKLLTPKLKLTVKERDNYTCQNCGKYMPDEVGLQIDHIKPINKGGKTILSNLQVLCSKCNGSKSNKYMEEDDNV